MHDAVLGPAAARHGVVRGRIVRTVAALFRPSSIAVGYAPVILQAWTAPREAAGNVHVSDA